MKMKLKPLLLRMSVIGYIIVSLASVTNCSFTALPGAVQDSIGQSDADIESANAKIKNAKNNQKNDFIQHSTVGYFGNQAIVENDTDILPPIFSDNIQIDKQFAGIRSIASGITDLTRIPTILDLSGMNNSNADDEACVDVRITQQDGNLTDLLNVITARCDLTWGYREGKIVLSDTETRTWSVKGIPGDINVNSEIQNNAGTGSQSGGAGGSGGGGSSGGGGAASTSSAQTQQSATQNTAYNLSNSLWDNLKDAIKLQLSKIGKVSISPSTSSLTVTDKPSVISRIDQYMRGQNNKLKRMVIIDVQLINVDVTAADNYGINWNAVLGGASGSSAMFSINGQAVASGGAAAATGAATTIPPLLPVFVPTNTTQAFTLGVNSGTMQGSQFIINALSTKSKTSLVTSTAVSTLSNQPVPLQFIDQQSYVASVQTTVTGAASTQQTSLNPGQLTTGFSLNLLPVVEGDGKVDLQISINISALKQIVTFTSGSGPNASSLQLPSTLQRNFMQKVVIKSGDTFVLTGFDEDTQAITNTGVGSPTNWWLGGGVSASKKRTRMVMLVTPTVVAN